MPEKQECPECRAGLVIFATSEGQKWVCKGPVQHRGFTAELPAPKDPDASVWNRLKQLVGSN